MKTHKIGSAIVLPLTYAASIDVTLTESVTLATLSLTGDATIDLDAESKCSPGDQVVFKLTADGTDRDVTFGTGFTGPVNTVTANKTDVVTFIYDGTGFIQTSAAVQID